MHKTQSGVLAYLSHTMVSPVFGTRDACTLSLEKNSSKATACIKPAVTLDSVSYIRSHQLLPVKITFYACSMVNRGF